VCGRAGSEATARQKPRGVSRETPWFDDASIGFDVVIFIECVIRFDHQWWSTRIRAERLSEHRDVKFQDEMPIGAINVR
jgi:hypothetical protein